MTEVQALEPRNLTEAQHLATIAAKTKMFGAKSPEEALVILLTGRELGLSSMQSMRAIHVVQGRPVLSADLMGALVRRAPDCELWQIVTSTVQVCTITTKRRADAAPVTMSWSMEDAKRAGLAAKDNWRAHPAAMLRARCTAALARAVYPDLLMGIYDPDELDPDAPVAAPTMVVPLQVPTLEAPDTNSPAPAALPALDKSLVWIKRIVAASSPSELDGIRLELNHQKATQCLKLTKTEGETLRRALETAALRIAKKASLAEPAPEEPEPEPAEEAEEEPETFTDDEERRFHLAQASGDT